MPSRSWERASSWGRRWYGGTARVCVVGPVMIGSNPGERLPDSPVVTRSSRYLMSLKPTSSYGAPENTSIELDSTGKAPSEHANLGRSHCRGIGHSQSCHRKKAPNEERNAKYCIAAGNVVDARRKTQEAIGIAPCLGSCVSLSSRWAQLPTDE